MRSLGGLCVQSAQGDKSESVLPKRYIAVESIGKDVVLYGRLGQPLGEFVTVSGQWFVYSHEKQGRPWFVVMEIDRVPLVHPIAFSVVESNVAAMPAVRDGDRWRLRCYENASFGGMPDRFFEESKSGPAGGVKPWRFQSSLHFVECTVVKPIDKMEDKRD